MKKKIYSIILAFPGTYTRICYNVALTKKELHAAAAACTVYAYRHYMAFAIEDPEAMETLYELGDTYRGYEIQYGVYVPCIYE